MGNSATKEQRPLPPPLRHSSAPISSGPCSPVPTSPGNPPSLSIYTSRNGRGSRPDLSFLGIGAGVDKDTAGLENRRETKQEKEARKLEKERITREKERHCSMREESVDGGFLVTQGVYTGIEDYNKGVVRQLMIERRIAPFWRGLNDHSVSWTENQLLAVARGRPLPAPDEIPNEDHLRAHFQAVSQPRVSEQDLHSLTVPISSRSQSYNSDTYTNTPPSLSPTVPATSSLSGPGMFRGRAKTLASLTTSSKNNSQTELTLREIHLPKDPFVNGQFIEAYLYKDAMECPICFLYYPPYLNKTRCCDQAICSECFVQIKRPDPHPPEHADPTAPPSMAIENDEPEGDHSLIAEPAACPFCVQPEFGITYEPPSFRRGLTYVNQSSAHPFTSSAMSSSSSLSSALGTGGRLSPIGASRRRTTSVSVTSSTVVTTDRIRPDWAQKLASAKAHAARRSAAATALHTAAYLMGDRNQDSETRGFGGFSRRAILRRANTAENSTGGSASTPLNMLALMSERYASSPGPRIDGSYGEGGTTVVGPVPRGGSRRNRIDDLEDMMMLEAIRLSLASEDDRRKREEKDAKKETKKKNKENKKAEKVAKKTGVYPSSANTSTAGLETQQSRVSNIRDQSPSTPGKGKAIPRTGTLQSLDGAPDLSSSRLATAPSESTVVDFQIQSELNQTPSQYSEIVSSLPYGTTSYKPSHLRTLSNASSSTSSIQESIPGSFNVQVGGSNSSVEASPNASGIEIPHRVLAPDNATPPGGGAGTEPMFNFQSLAAMIGRDEKGGKSVHREYSVDANDENELGHQRGESSSSASIEAGLKPDLTDSINTLTESTSTLKPEWASHQNRISSNVNTPEVRITAPSRANSGPLGANAIHDSNAQEGEHDS